MAMRSMLCFFALLLALPAVTRVASVGPNVNVSNESGPQSSTDIAVDPTNPNHILGSSNDIAGAYMRAYESFDGGVSWTNTPLPMPPAPYEGSRADRDPSESPITWEP